MNIILCEHGCGQPAKHITKGKKHQCAPHHRSCPAVLNKGYKTNFERYGGKQPACSSTVIEKMKSTTIERFGVENASSSQIIKNKKKRKSLIKYGVDNVSKAPEIKETLSQKAKERWQIIYADKDFSVNGLTRKQYSNRVNQYANTQYQQYKHILDPDNKRGKHWHLDHIYSVTDGFLNNVPIYILSDVTNLRLISDSENYAKHLNSHKSLNKLYEDYYYPTSFS